MQSCLLYSPLLSAIKSQLQCTQAESDHHVRDAYNYMTVQTDIARPKRQMKVVEDTVRQAAWTAAIKDAVTSMVAEDMDCRVLDLGAGAGKSTDFLLRSASLTETSFC